MNLIKSTGTFSLFVILSRILGYIRDFFIAIYLGSGPIADAFFVAFRIPNTFRRLFAEGTFNAAFVPSYTSELLSSKKKAQKLNNEWKNISCKQKYNTLKNLSTERLFIKWYTTNMQIVVIKKLNKNFSIAWSFTAKTKFTT